MRKQRILVFSTAFVLTLAAVFLSASKYLSSRTSDPYHLEFIGFETNAGSLEACFRLQTRGVVPLRELGITMQREIQNGGKWVSDSNWSAVPRISASRTELLLYVPAPDDQQRWRLSAQLVLKPLLFREGELSLTTKPIEARALTGLLLK